METLKNQSQFVQDSEFNRYGIISVIILITGCLGGITVGLGAIDYLITLILVVVPTMLTLSLLLAVAPMKQIFIVGGISVIIDVILIVYFLMSK